MFGSKRKRYGNMSPSEQAEFAANVSGQVTTSLVDYAAAYLNSLSKEKRSMLHSVVVSVVPAKAPNAGCVGVVTNPAYASTHETKDRLMLLEVLEMARNEVDDYRQQVIQKLGFDPLWVESEADIPAVRH